MRVGFNKIWGAMMLGLAGVNLYLATLTGRGTTAIIGLVVGAVGLAFLAGHQLEVADGEIRVKNAWGMTMRRYAFSSRADLRIEGSTLYCRDQKVKGAGGLMSSGADWDLLAAWIREPE